MTKYKSTRSPRRRILIRTPLANKSKQYLKQMKITIHLRAMKTRSQKYKEKVSNWLILENNLPSLLGLLSCKKLMVNLILSIKLRKKLVSKRKRKTKRKRQVMNQFRQVNLEEEQAKMIKNRKKQKKRYRIAETKKKAKRKLRKQIRCDLQINYSSKYCK